MNIARIAWRNVWRNKRRSILSFSSIFCACIIITFLFGLLTGMDKDLERNLKSYVSGDIRIRNKKYQEHEKLNPIPYFVAERNTLRASLETIDKVEAVLPRIVLPVTTFRDTQEAFVVEGIDPGLNEDFRDFSTLVTAGTDFRVPHEGIIPAVIGEGLAKKLDLAIGDSITALTTTVFRSSNAMTFTIVGTARLQIPQTTYTTLFVPITAAERLSMMAGGATELLVRVAQSRDTQSVRDAIEQLEVADDLEVQKWDTVSTTSLMLRFGKIVYAFIALIFFILGSVAIINTTIMSIFERKYEIGLLGSLGMQKSLIRRLFFSESVFISLLGAGIGVVIGTGIVLITGYIGIDIAGQIDGLDMEVSETLYPYADPLVIIAIFLYALCVSLVATLIPTRKIIKMQPIDALREE